jgi:cytochrome P450
VFFSFSNSPLTAGKTQIQLLVAKLAEDGAAGCLSDLSLAFRCLAQDIMTEICLGISSKTLEAPGYKSPLIIAMDENLRFFVPMKTFPIFRRLMYSLPPNLTPGEEVLTDYETMVENHVSKAIKDPCSFDRISPATMLSYLVDRSGQSALDTESLIGELQAFIVGGGETVASAMVFGVHGILRHHDLYPRLQAELIKAWPNVSDPAPDLETLEKLPLLTASIKESLRLTHGVVSPLPRIVPDEGAQVDGHFVPGGTSVGVSHVFVHLSPSLFQDPQKFEPQRWLYSPSEKGGSSLDKYLVAFSRGPRSCTGRNLAWCELYISFATLLRQFDMEYSEEENDTTLKWRDCFQALYYGRHLQVRCMRRMS